MAHDPTLSSLENKQNELWHIDFLRLLSSYAIVFYHFSPFSQQELAIFTRHFDHLAVAVDLFIIISGFVISYIYEQKMRCGVEYYTFLWRRISRLAPLHWATLSFYILLGILFSTGRVRSAHPEDYDWNCLVPNALAIHAWGFCRSLTFNPVSWSISAEMGMYLITPILLSFGRNSGVGLLIVALATIAFLYWISAFIGKPWYEWTYRFGVARALPDFMFGVSAFFLRDFIGKIPIPFSGLIFGLISLVTGVLLNWSSDIVVLFAYITATFAIACDMKGKPYKWLIAFAKGGRLTYSIYMLHPILLTLLLNIVGVRVLHLKGNEMNIWIIVVAILVYPVSYISYEWFEAPTRRWMAGSLRRGTSV